MGGLSFADIAAIGLYFAAVLVGGSTRCRNG